jgi:hypothetical protein
MIKIGINTDNWRHEDKPVEYCLPRSRNRASNTAAGGGRRHRVLHGTRVAPFIGSTPTR